MYSLQLRDVQRARQNISPLVLHTPLTANAAFSELMQANVLLKREDLQVVRSYKLRGAYNKILSLTHEQRAKGIVCASAGNHAQGVAYSCSSLGINGAIFMPVTTPLQKKRQVEKFGKDKVTIVSVGDTFDDAFAEAQKYCKERGSNFIHPFDDEKVIEGQATVGFDILDDANVPIDYLFVPIGGGGLAAGIGSVFKSMSPDTKVIGVEPAGAACMKASIDAGEIVALKDINTFADGVAVRRAGELTFNICKNVLHDIVVVPEGKICTTILQLYNDSAIVVEPAGAISLAALDFYKKQIKGKNVICIVSGSNNDITRMEEIKERSQLYEGLKHYFIIRFAQRSGALREFLDNILGDTADITHFEYRRKNFMEKGSAIIGIELKHADDIKPLLLRMQQGGVQYDYLNEHEDVLRFFI